MKFDVKNLAEMQTLARDMATQITKSKDMRILILLEGPMGAGKTQFTRYFIEALGSTETASPSFAIHHRYQTRKGNVDHFDLFRLENEEDLESTGFWDLFLDSNGLMIVEWADRLNDLGLQEQLPKQWRKIKVSIQLSGLGQERALDIEGWN